MALAVQDGIDLVYDVEVGILQVVVWYRKVIVSNSADDSILACMKGVGVGVVAEEDAGDHALLLRSDDLVENILPGMDFLDHSYVMRVVSVTASEIRAKAEGLQSSSRCDNGESYYRYEHCHLQ